jgi:hypothetical protein
VASSENSERSPRLSRRGALRAFGIGTAGAVVGPSVLADQVAAAAHTGGHAAVPNHFGRLFPTLPPFARSSPSLRAALLELGRPAGLLDAGDDLSAGPVRLITDPALSRHNPNNPTHTAGTTFLGQFIDHDVTFDASSRLGVRASPTATRNFRSPALDLDSLYGAGYVAQQELYDATDPIKLRIESGGLFEDVPRRADGAAILADPRNDEHIIIAGLHAAFIRLHNACVDRVRASGTHVPSVAFAQARRLVTWHYQWIVVHEFLPQICGHARVRAALRHRRLFRPRRGQAQIPVEFQAAAYRMGHSMVRPSYRVNLAGDAGQPFFGFIFDRSQDGVPDAADLRGGQRAPRRFVGWQTFFDFGDGQVKPNKLIDTRLSTPLFHLPLGAIASHDHPTALAQRTLLRHLTWSLPSGQAIAREIGEDPLTRQDLRELAPLGHRLDRSTPLWYYVLREAELVEDGLRLGPVGGSIVAEVLIGLMQTDPASWLCTHPRWRPTLESSSAGDFRMTDLLTLAGVDPATRGQ